MIKENNSYTKTVFKRAVLITLICCFAVIGIAPLLSISKVSAEELYEKIGGNLATECTYEYRHPNDAALNEKTVMQGNMFDTSFVSHRVTSANFYFNLKKGDKYEFFFSGSTSLGSQSVEVAYPGGNDLSFVNEKGKVHSFIATSDGRFYISFQNDYQREISAKGSLIVQRYTRITPEGTQLKPQMIAAKYLTKGQYVMGGSSDTFAEIVVKPDFVYILDLNDKNGDIVHFDVEFLEYGGRFFKTYGQLIFKTKGTSFKLRVNTECEFFPTLRFGAYEDVEKAENFMYESLRDLDKPPVIEDPTDKPIDKPTDKPTDEPTDKPTDEPTDKPNGEEVIIENGFVKFFENVGNWFVSAWGKVSAWFSSVGQKVTAWFKGGTNG